MTEVRDILLQLSALKAIKDRVDENEKALKAELQATFGGRMGATAAVLPDGAEAGTVSIAKGRYPQGTAANGWKVNDPDSFAKWAKTYRPSSIVERVRESDVQSLLTAMPSIIEAAGGEIPPGVVEAQRGSDYVMVKQSDDQLGNLVKAWTSGAVDFSSLAQIGGSSDDERP